MKEIKILMLISAVICLAACSATQKNENKEAQKESLSEADNVAAIHPLAKYPYTLATDTTKVLTTVTFDKQLRDTVKSVKVNVKDVLTNKSLFFKEFYDVTGGTSLGLNFISMKGQQYMLEFIDPATGKWILSIPLEEPR